MKIFREGPGTLSGVHHQRTGQGAPGDRRRSGTDQVPVVIGTAGGGPEETRRPQCIGSGRSHSQGARFSPGRILIWLRGRRIFMP